MNRELSLPDNIDYFARESFHARNRAMFHSEECNEANVNAFCNDEPEPGCICGRTDQLLKEAHACTTR